MNTPPRKHKQIAIVVRDLEKSLEHYVNTLGIGPWDVRRFTPQTVRDFHVYGQRVTEDFEFVIAVCWEGDLEWELIQPMRGPNIYWRHLEVHGEGLHHVKEIIEDARIPDALEDFKAKGCEVLQTGWIDGDVHYYLDTEKLLGFVYEIGNGGQIGPAEQRYPAGA